MLWRCVYKIAENNWVTGGITLVSGGFCTLLTTGHGAHFVEMFDDFLHFINFQKGRFQKHLGLDHGTVDVRNPAPVDMETIPFLIGFQHHRWCRISSINSSCNLWDL